MLPRKPSHRTLNILSSMSANVENGKSPLIRVSCSASRKPHRLFYDNRIVAGIVTKPCTSLTQGTATSGSHMMSPNRETLTNSNTDVMPKESIVLYEGFPISNDCDFNDL